MKQVTSPSPSPKRSRFDSDINCWFDGACRGNYPVEKIGFCGIISDLETGEDREFLSSLFSKTRDLDSFISEHCAALLLIKNLVKSEYKNKTILVRGDNQVVVKQLYGEYSLDKTKPYYKYARESKALIRELKIHNTVTFTWISRDQNKRADKLSKEALDLDSGVRVIYTMQN